MQLIRILNSTLWEVARTANRHKTRDDRRRCLRIVLGKIKIPTDVRNACLSDKTGAEIPRVTDGMVLSQDRLGSRQSRTTVDSEVRSGNSGSDV